MKKEKKRICDANGDVFPLDVSVRICADARSSRTIRLNAHTKGKDAGSIKCVFKENKKHLIVHPGIIEEEIVTSVTDHWLII